MDKETVKSKSRSPTDPKIQAVYTAMFKHLNSLILISVSSCYIVKLQSILIRFYTFSLHVSNYLSLKNIQLSQNGLRASVNIIPQILISVTA